jgi:hypothetical protein
MARSRTLIPAAWFLLAALGCSGESTPAAKNDTPPAPTTTSTSSRVASTPAALPNMDDLIQSVGKPTPAPPPLNYSDLILTSGGIPSAPTQPAASPSSGPTPPPPPLVLPDPGPLAPLAPVIEVIPPVVPKK